MTIQTPASNSAHQSASGSKLILLNAPTIFVSAFLLFQVEPLIAKIILPWFGGVAAVWTVCLLFFQVALLLGYLYAHLLTQHLGPRVQGWLHAGLLVISLLVLPILPSDSWKPTGPDHPALHILVVLVLTVGLPFFLLSATSPLLQAWLASIRKDSGVYRFYALSNAGSLLGLLSYPTLVEPQLSTRLQAWSWSVAYVAFAVACGAIAVSQRRGEDTARQEEVEIAPTDRDKRALWVGLSACSSALLLAITNHITQNIAAVPFLWIIPLSLYMLSFILCFGSSRWYHRMFFLRVLGVALGCLAYALSPSLMSLPLWILISLFCAGLFICCMFCHGELARLKPDPSQLTSFYFWSSLGSVLGAVFVAILAPQIFSGFYELHVALGACALLAVMVHRMDPASPFQQATWQPGLWALHGLAVILIVSLFFVARAESVYADRTMRNFYGVLRESDEVAPNVVLLKDDAQAEHSDLSFRRLMNGTITHGLQFLAPARRDLPISYYGPHSGIGVAFVALASRGPLRVGVIGLGTGTIAAYGHAGDEFTFYEINPLVVQVAQRDFTFLRDSKACIAFELGDARLTLERQPPQQLDLLAVDAFSSDAIPVHLLTIEAFQLYFRHLRPDGILAVHISNRHLYLEPVVAAAAQKLGKDAVLIVNPDDDANEIFLARWVLLANPGVFAGLPNIRKTGRPLASNARVRLWTDSYSSLFPVLK
ncbi:MAG TPA: fused MFS/spermidine synthase [Candidatus Acidoferrum sp.]